MSPIYSGGSGGGTPTGGSTLVYRKTVTGADVASIDTGVDTPDAGTNDWTNGDLLEWFLYARTDEAVTSSVVDWFVNNDTATNYEVVRIRDLNVTVTGAIAAARAGGFTFAPGSSDAANMFGQTSTSINFYGGTTNFKTAVSSCAIPDPTAANKDLDLWGVTWKSASAITRLKVAPNTGGSKLKVGSQLLIYKRTTA